jgi:hypothetical protein
MNPTKLSLHFSVFFYDFLRILQDSAKQQFYLRFTFAPGSLELLRNSQICPWFTKNSLERMGSLQLGPWGNHAGIRRGRRCSGPGRWGKRVWGSPVLAFVGWMGRLKAGRGSSAAPGVCRRGGGEIW